MIALIYMVIFDDGCPLHGGAAMFNVCLFRSIVKTIAAVE
jgi:hypothetical protein